MFHLGYVADNPTMTTNMTTTTMTTATTIGDQTWLWLLLLQGRQGRERWQQRLWFLLLFSPPSIAMSNGLEIRCQKERKNHSKPHPNFETYSLIAAIWKIWSELPGDLLPMGWGKKTLFWDRLWTMTKHISATEHDINNRKETCESTGTPLHVSKFGKLWSRNSWERLASFCPPP